MMPISSLEREDTLRRRRASGGGYRQFTWRRRDAGRRLHCIAGHLRGIGRMVDAGSTRDVFDQIRAVRRALRRVSLLLLEEHIEKTAALSHSAWDNETMERALLETRDALLGDPVTEGGGWDETFPLGQSEEDACPTF